MATKFNTVPAILEQLRRTYSIVENFIDEVKSDDLPRYNNVDAHLSKLKYAVDDTEQALVALLEFHVPSATEVDKLIDLIDHAIKVLEEKKSLEETGALAEAESALRRCESFLQDYVEER